MKEFDGDDDKLSAEYQQDIESASGGLTGVQGLCCGVASSVYTRRARMLYHGLPEPVEFRQL